MNLPTTKTPLKADPRFVVVATPNSFSNYIYSLYVNDQYVMCTGIDGIKRKDGTFERYTEKQALVTCEEFANKVLERAKQGNPYKRGDLGMATRYLNY